VKDIDDQLVAIFYADFFPRKGKRNGAWMTSYKSQFIKEGLNERLISPLFAISRKQQKQTVLVNI
jgi:Zn-dependent oligopeptidase